MTFKDSLTRRNDGGCVTSVMQSHDPGHLIVHTHHTLSLSCYANIGNTIRTVSSTARGLLMMSESRVGALIWCYAHPSKVARILQGLRIA